MLIMNDKTILARLKRSWQGQEKDRLIWNEGIIPNFISPNGEYNPISFTCYQLFKILQDSFSYQNLYKHLKKYEIENFLVSKLITNENNRKERIYSFPKRILTWGIHTIKYVQNKEEKVESQKLFELIQEYNHPKKIYNDYVKKKISKDTALNTLQHVINEGGDIFENHRLESSFLLSSLKYVVKISKKDDALFSYLEAIVVSHIDGNLQEKAVEYIKKYFPKLFEINLSRYLEGKYFHTSYYSSKTLDDYILTDERLSRFRRFGSSFKQLKDRKLLDFDVKAKEKLGKYRRYYSELNRGDYDVLTNSLVYRWGRVRVACNEIKGFEQEPYKIVLSADLRKQNKRHIVYNDLWRLTDRNFYFSLKIFTTVLNIKEKDVMVAIPFLHTNERGWDVYKSRIKMFSEKTDFIIYIMR